MNRGTPVRLGGTRMVVRVHPPKLNAFSLGGETGSHLAYTQKSRGQNLPERPAFALRATARRAILPLSVKVCTPVSETGRAEALPAAAANLIRADFNKEQTPHRGGAVFF